jgi:hypothetical protein
MASQIIWQMPDIHIYTSDTRLEIGDEVSSMKYEVQIMTGDGVPNKGEATPSPREDTQNRRYVCPQPTVDSLRSRSIVNPCS